MDSALQNRLNAAADVLISMGLSVIPISVETKKPTLAWSERVDSPMTSAEWRISGVGCNLALITGMISKYVVVDCDSAESYKGWLRSKPLTPLRVRTKRGMHFYYQHPGADHYIKSGSHIKDEAGFEYDVKGERSYVVFPPSMRGGHQYQIVPCSGNLDAKLLAADTLPVFDPAWRPETRMEHRHEKAISDGVAYISKIRAVAGNGGDRDTFRAACRLRDSGLSEVEALVAMLEWNRTNAEPPWSERELLHKVRCTFEGES